MATIVEKLQKMIEHEKSAREMGSIHEAEAFAGRISALLAEHKLTMTDVEVSAQERDDPFGEEVVLGTGWRTTLLHGVCMSMFCKLLRSGAKLTVLGRDGDRAAAIQLYSYLATQGQRMAVDSAARMVESSEFAAAIQRQGCSLAQAMAVEAQVRRDHKASFLKGFSHALYTRLKPEQANIAAASASGAALVLRESAALEAFTKQQYPNVGKGRASGGTIRDSSGYHAGRAAGSSIGIRSTLALR